MATPVVRFQIDIAGHPSVGPDGIALLEAIRDCGSLSRAARRRAISYRHAWMVVDALNNVFREPVTITVSGGRGGRGVHLTAFGAMLIRKYRELEQEIAILAVRRLDAIVPFVATPLPRRAAPSPALRAAVE